MSALRAERTVARVTWGLLLRGKRWLIVLAASGLPLLVSWVFVANVGGLQEQAGTFFAGMAGEMILTVLLPLTALVHGTGAFGLEIDDGTIRFLLTKPIARWRIALAKWQAAAWATLVSILPGIVGSGWLLLGSPLEREVLAWSAGAALAAFLYAAVFLALSLLTRRALILGLVYVLVWEGTLSRLFTGVRVMSVRAYSEATAEALATPGPVPGDEVLRPAVLLVLALLVGGAALLYTSRKLVRLEVAEEV